MFIDIRGFTRLAETMAPHELGEMLREFRGAVGGCIREGEGVVDKFVGDAVLAVFGTPRPRADDAARALRAALDVLERVAGWSAGRAKTGSPAIAVGIGLHYGEVFAGVLGDDAMLEHTVIGDTVNVAERLERLTRVLPGCLVVSEAIERAAGLSLDESRWQHLTAVQVEGRAGTIAVAVLRNRAYGATQGASACLPAPIVHARLQ